MIYRILAGITALLLSSAASAQTCTIPNTLTNGTNADATQVMANFNALIACINSSSGTVPIGYLSGLTMANNVSSPTTVLNVSTGMAASDDGLALMKVASAVTKTVNTAWAVGTGNGCLDAGSIAASTWYHLYVIVRPDTGVVDQLCSTSPTSPTLPTNYTKKRRIGSYKTNGSSQVIAFVQNYDTFLWAVGVRDVANQSQGTSGTLWTLASIPTGVQVQALVNVCFYVTGAASGAFVSSPLVSDQAVLYGIVQNVRDNSAGSGACVGLPPILTDTSARIRARGGASGFLDVSTQGWVDSRGK